MKKQTKRKMKRNKISLDEFVKRESFIELCMFLILVLLFFASIGVLIATIILKMHELSLATLMTITMGAAVAYFFRREHFIGLNDEKRVFYLDAYKNYLSKLKDNENEIKELIKFKENEKK